MQESTSFDRIDLETAQAQYDNWAAKKCETLDEFMMRKRRIELNNLVKKVIEAELSKTEKEIVKLHWYNEKSLMETAEILGLSKSTVSKKLARINETVYEKLKYAIEYRFGKNYLAQSEVIIKNKDPFINSIKPNGTAKRIRHLRISQAMTLNDVSEMTGIGVKRLERIESAENDATSTDLAKIASAFRTSIDYIVFGERERKWQ